MRTLSLATIAAASMAAFLTLTACKSTGASSQLREDTVGTASGAAFVSNPEGEIIPADEVAQFKDAADFIRELQVKNEAARQAKTGDANLRRGFHAKGHACVQAQLHVADAIPAELRRGIFTEPGKDYGAWVRYSNGNPKVQPDYAPDFRGFAIKVGGVSGDRVLAAPGSGGEPEAQALDAQHDSDSQDFLMLANPRMVAGTGPRFMEFTRASQLPPLQFAKYLIANPDIAAFLAEFQLFRYFDSARYNEFFSGSAIKYGDKIVHYKVSPCAGDVPKINAYLHAANFALVEALIAKVDTLAELTADERAVFHDLVAHVKDVRQKLKSAAANAIDQVPIPQSWINKLAELRSRIHQRLGGAAKAVATNAADTAHDLQDHMTATMRASRAAMLAYFTRLIANGREAELAAILQKINEAWAAHHEAIKDYLRTDLVDTLKDEAICYDFAVQLPPGGRIQVPANPTAQDFQASYVENASIEWQEDQAPFVKVATLTIAPRTLPTLAPLADGIRPLPPQACDAGASEEECVCEKLNFSPWNAVADHRPLGSINRIRKFVYNKSQTTRAQSIHP